MSKIAERTNKLVEEFNAISAWEDRYKKIISLGKELPDLDDAFRTETFRVKGCQSQVWLHAKLDDDQVIYQSDSDAMIVRGLIAILIDIYSNNTPQEILAHTPNFLKEMGLRSHLSQTRTNGLHAMIEQIFNFARAFDSILRSKKS